MEIEKKKAQEMLSRFKISDPAWSNFRKALFEASIDEKAVASRSKVLNFDNNNPNVLELSKIEKLLMRTNVSDLDLIKIYDSISEFDKPELVKLENLLGIIGFITKMDASTKKSYSIVSSVLNYSDGSSISNRANLKSITNNCLSLMSRRIGKVNVSVNTDITDNVMVKAKNSDIHQVVLNILSNALDALDVEGYEEKYIKIKLQNGTENNFQKLVIENNGPKIDETEHRKIFDRGYTTKDDKTKGLGLYICKKLIEKNEGEISVTSDNKSTYFELQFKKE
jgi:signal transduction histidine kinase